MKYPEPMKRREAVERCTSTFVAITRTHKDILNSTSLVLSGKKSFNKASIVAQLCTNSEIM